MRNPTSRRLSYRHDLLKGENVVFEIDNDVFRPEILSRFSWGELERLSLLLVFDRLNELKLGEPLNASSAKSDIDFRLALGVAALAIFVTGRLQYSESLTHSLSLSLFFKCVCSSVGFIQLH